MDSVASNRIVSVEEAAWYLGVEPAAVRMFVRQRFLRLACAEPMGVWEVDVLRLLRVMNRASVPPAGSHAEPHAR
jgi:hypothetical protein